MPWFPRLPRVVLHDNELTSSSCRCPGICVHVERISIHNARCWSNTRHRECRAVFPLTHLVFFQWETIRGAWNVTFFSIMKVIKSFLVSKTSLLILISVRGNLYPALKTSFPCIMETIKSFLISATPFRIQFSVNGELYADLKRRSVALWTRKNLPWLRRMWKVYITLIMRWGELLPRDHYAKAWTEWETRDNKRVMWR